MLSVELMTDNPLFPARLAIHLKRHDCVLFTDDALDSKGLPSARLAAALVDACSAHYESAQLDHSTLNSEPVCFL